MRIKFIITCLVVFTFLSCKNEGTKESKTTEQNEAKVDNSFKVTLELKVSKDENMHLYYTEDGSIKFAEESSIWTAVKGSDNFQEVGFVFPEDVVPTAIRLDLGYGKNLEQSDVELKKFKISYLGKTIEAQDAFVFDYFYPTEENTKRIEGTNKLARLDKAQVSGPILYPNENLLAKIKELTTGSK